MKRLTFIACFTIIALYANAQSYHICNSNGTTLEIPVKENSEITFDSEQQLIHFHNIGNLVHSFATSHIDSIATSKPVQSTSLTYLTEQDIKFDPADESIYSEVTETIVEDELLDEYGDFVEHYQKENLSLVTIEFSETGVKTTPTSVENVKFTVKNKTHLIIDSTTGKMRYNVKGKCSNGSLKIYSTKKFQLMLGGLELTNPTGPAINIQTSKTIYFTLGSGTKNSLCDGATYAAAPVTNNEEEDQKGTLFSEGQIIFNGNGTLNVTSLGGHAICSDDYIRVRSGKINILSSLKDGFHTNDMFIVGRTEKYSPEINVNSTGDAVDCGKGSIRIEAGKLTFNSGGEAIKASYEEAVPDPAIIPDVNIAGGLIKIVTDGAKSSAIKATGNYRQLGGIIQAEVNGNGSKIINCDGSVAIEGGKITGITKGSLNEADTTSAAGIKSAGDIYIGKATVAMRCDGSGSKAINCDSAVTIDGGNVILLATGENINYANDDKKSRAVSCTDLTIESGTLYTQAYDKAVSAESITLNDGTLHAISSNDTEAINVLPTQKGGWIMTKGEE